MLYTLWHGSGLKVMSIVHPSRNSFKHELLAGNLVGLPIFQEHGEIDDNVPVFHSRQMFQLLGEKSIRSSLESIEYFNELPSKEHWY